jgi:hypothetical protein
MLAMRLRNATVVLLAVAGACRSYNHYVSPPAGSSGSSGASVSGASGASGASSGSAGSSGGEDDGGAGGDSMGGRGTGGKAGAGSGGSGDAGAANGGSDKGGHGGKGGGGGNGNYGGGNSASGGSSASTAGVAGSPNTAGEGGDGGGIVEPEPVDLPEFCALDETIVSECPLNQILPPVAVPQVQHLTSAPIETYGGFHVLATQPGSSTLVISWGDPDSWTGWHCFDVVAHVSRVAAARLRNDFSEAFAVTECGTLHDRRMVQSNGEVAWSTWSQMKLPTATSVATDVATSVSGDGTNHLYVADRGRVFVRRRISEAAFAAFGPWSEVGAQGARTIAAGLSPDGRQELLFLDAEGAPHFCRQRSAELDAGFDACEDFAADDVPRLIDLDVPTGLGTNVLVFALDEDGVVWQRERDGSGTFGVWQKFRSDEQPFMFTEIASAGVHTYPGLPLLFVGVANGGVYATRRVNDVWEPWARLVP